jgi:hypothetical protein
VIDGDRRLTAAAVGLLGVAPPTDLSPRSLVAGRGCRSSVSAGRASTQRAIAPIHAGATELTQVIRRHDASLAVPSFRVVFGWLSTRERR